MANKRKKTGTSSHADDADAEGTRKEASLEASSHEDPSAYLTRDEMDGVLAELRTIWQGKTISSRNNRK